MAMFITFERRRRWIGTSISRSFNIFVNDSQELSKTPKALIDTLINLTSSYDDDSEATRGRYLFNLRSLFALRLLSKPTVSSTIYKNFLRLLCNIRSGLDVFPLIKLGDGKEGKSA